MENIPYPKSPKVNVIDLRAISPSYKAQVIKVLFSIILFIFTYLAVLAFSILIFWLSLLAAGAIIRNLKGLYALIIIVGIVLSAGMFVYFVIKFLFQIKKDVDNSRVELQEADQPQLFEFVRRVCEETEAPFPNKIVISPAVNASVFYNSSFLSMFLPVRKNLEIGAGLLNCINITEFKAILAHEFGHFSQSSTRLGSYTYRFNRVVHNLLYENEGWLDALTAISSTHAVLAFFGQVTIWLVRGVMELFVAVYKLINISYMALSREMEFHADCVAVSVSGSAPIISALRRLELGQTVYQYTVQGILNYKADKTSRPQNFFALHRENLIYVAGLNHFTIENGLPLINEEYNKTMEPRLRYKDVWASHPDIEERMANAFKKEITAEMIYESPWILFKNAEKLQETLSIKVPELVVDKNESELVANDLLLLYMRQEEAKNKINPLYLDYYTYANNTFTPIEEKDFEITNNLGSLSFSDVFNTSIVEQLKIYYRDVNDTQTIKLISEGHLHVKRFEFEGKQYTRYYSGDIFKQLKNETDAQKESLEKYNKKISTWFYLKALEKDSEGADSYKNLLNFNQSFINKAQTIHDLFQEHIRFYHEHIAKHRDAEDIPYQAKKVREIYQSTIKAQKELKDIELPEKLKVDFELGIGFVDATNLIITDPGAGNDLNGFNPLYDDLKLFTEKLDAIAVDLTRRVIKQQDHIITLLN